MLVKRNKVLRHPHPGVVTPDRKSTLEPKKSKNVAGPVSRTTLPTLARSLESGVLGLQDEQVLISGEGSTNFFFDEERGEAPSLSKKIRSGS